MRIKVSDYLVKKLAEFGIEEVFGLPGDYNFDIVEAIEKSEKINWIGSTNELNAGYAADGYARIKGYGAIVTTFGVGELSAINAVAGCFSENVPVVKIVGVPSIKHIKNKTLLHHNLVSANYKAFYEAYKNVVQEASFLTLENPKEEIDRLFETMKKTKMPVYLAIPMDVSTSLVEVEEINKEEEKEKSSEENLKKAAGLILGKIKKSTAPILVADILAQRFGAKEEINEFLKTSKIPSTSFIRGMDIIETGTKNYFGPFSGKIANLDCSKYLNTSDCVILAGAVVSDLNTMNFAFDFDIEKAIDIQADFVIIDGEKIENVLIKDLFLELNKEILKEKYEFKEEYKRTFRYEALKETPKGNLALDYFYRKMESFIKENDILITEVGLVPFGVLPYELPKNISIQNQILWGSIGWATPCTLGCSIADRSRRTILITGDGAHQLTAQEISTMMRNKLKPIVFVVNNSGYTVERILCDDVNYKYNDIASWKYSLLPKAFKGECFSAKVEKNEELDTVLEKIKEEQKEKMCYIELCCDYLDFPPLAKAIAKHPEQLK